MKKIILFSSFAVFSTLFLVSCASRPDTEFSEEVEEHIIHFRNGHLALSQGNYEQAEKEFKSAIERYPNNAPYHNYLGLTYFLEKKYQEALLEFDKGLLITTEYGDLYNNRGLVFLALGKNDQALEDFKKALNTPAYATPEAAYFNIGRIYYIQEQWAEAAFNFEKSIDTLKKRKSQVHPEALCYYGISLLKQGKYYEAVTPLNEAVKVNSKYMLAQYNLGIAFFVLGEKEKALKHFMEVKTLLPSSDPLHASSIEYINKIRQGN